MNTKNTVMKKSLAVASFGFLTVAVGLGGCAVSAEEGQLELEEGVVEESEQNLSQYVAPGACTVGTIKTNRQILALNCVDWAFRQATTDGRSFDWVNMSTLKIGATTYSNGPAASRAACQAVVLPKQADLTCVQANPPMYSVRIR